MSITLEDVAKLHHDNLRTVGAKIIYLTIRNAANEDGWAAISLAQLARATSLTRQGLIKTLKRLQDVGLVEVKNDKASPTSRNQYRVITL